MLVSCWSAKGGSGTTVVAAALALLISSSSRAGALLVDLAGDIPTALGLPEPQGPGLSGWLEAGDDVPPDALARLELGAGGGLSVLARGDRLPNPAVRADALAAALAADARPVVADCGLVNADGGATMEYGRTLAGAATHSLLVIRPCFLALRRALQAPLRPSGVVVVAEAGRALGPDDVEEVLQAPVRAVVDLEREVFRVVDAGLLASRLPRALERGLRDAA